MMPEPVQAESDCGPLLCCPKYPIYCAGALRCVQCESVPGISNERVVARLPSRLRCSTNLTSTSPSSPNRGGGGSTRTALSPHHRIGRSPGLGVVDRYPDDRTTRCLGHSALRAARGRNDRDNQWTGDRRVRLGSSMAFRASAYPRARAARRATRGDVRTVPRRGSCRPRRSPVSSSSSGADLGRRLQPKPRWTESRR